MKILHINAIEHGGAANSAIRLHKGLLESGVDSRFLFLKPTAKKSIDHTVVVDKIPTVWYSVLKNVPLIRRFFFERHVTKPTDVDWISYPTTINRIEKLALFSQYDVIHLHWVSGYINFPTFFNEIQKPIFWTFHDLNPVKGIFHYECDEKRHPELANIERKYQKVKAKSLKNSNVSCVAPSKWLKEKIENSFARDLKTYHVPYGVSTDIFYPENKIDAKKELGLSLEKKHILYVGANLNNPRKGVEYFLELTKLFKNQDNVLFLLAGQGDIASHDNVLSVGQIDDEAHLRRIYSAADVTLITSIEDNLPNVVLESMACGTPVAGFKIGGIPDLVIEQQTGFMASLGDVDALKGIINNMLKEESLLQQMRENCDKMIRRNYTLKHQASNYIKLYNETIGVS